MVASPRSENSLAKDRAVELVHVFTADGRGGNPCPIVVDAEAMAPDEMQAIARLYGHESAFVLPPPSPDFDMALRFWVPNHEMEMCGHATIGALHLMVEANRIDATRPIRISTPSGAVTGFAARNRDGRFAIDITQPAGKVRDLNENEHAKILKTLRLIPDDLLDLPIQNAVTSRVKTLIPLRRPDRLHAIEPDTMSIDAVCASIGSTGFYPFAPHRSGSLDNASQAFEARQFPRQSGYPEDAATGIAASALAFGLLTNGLVEASSRPWHVPGKSVS
ncbi:MAG: PhzF family phenazine biosynthesis isomerase, partial [Pseudomonadota bacterium]